MKRLLLLLPVLALLLPLSPAAAQDGDEPTEVFRWEEYGLSFVYPAAWGDRLAAEDFWVISTDATVLDSFVDPTELALVVAVLPPDNPIFLDPSATPAPDATLAPEATLEPTDFDPIGDFQSFIVANEFFGPEVPPSFTSVDNTYYGLKGIARAPEDDPLHQQIAVLSDFQVTFLLRLYDPQNIVTPEAFDAVLDSAILSGVTVPFPTPEPEEPFAADALPITSGERVTGELGDDDDAIFYVFEASAGQYATIFMEADDDLDLDTTIYLYADDNEIAWNDDGIPGTLNSRLLNIELPEATRYVIEAAKYDGAGAFTLSLTVTDLPDLDLLLADATESGELFYGDRITDNLQRTNQTRYYVFEAAAGDEILILMEANNPEQFDTLLSLYDADGILIARNDDEAPGNLNSRIETVLTESGRYYIVAGSYFGSGPYELLLDRQ